MVPAQRASKLNGQRRGDGGEVQEPKGGYDSSTGHLRSVRFLVTVPEEKTK